MQPLSIPLRSVVANNINAQATAMANCAKAKLLITDNLGGGYWDRPTSPNTWNFWGGYFYCYNHVLDPGQMFVSDNATVTAWAYGVLSKLSAHLTPGNSFTLHDLFVAALSK